MAIKELAFSLKLWQLEAIKNLRDTTLTLKVTPETTAERLVVLVGQCVLNRRGSISMVTHKLQMEVIPVSQKYVQLAFTQMVSRSTNL